MAVPQQVEILLEGVESWNQWCRDNGGVGAGLDGANLRGADLRMAHLRGANLRGADLSGANLRGANLRGADLSGADLSGAYLHGAYLSGANLRGANLTEANLSWAEIDGANLSGASLREANLSWAYLREANLTEARLRETLFGNSNLTDAKGLDKCNHRGPSTLDHRTLARSGQLPLLFLRGCGLPDTLINYLPSLLNQPIQFFSCFISYSHEDKPFARRLHDALQGRGIRCWLDEKQLLPGDDIHEQIDRGIRLWDKVLLCCSIHSLTSWWVDGEIERAFQKEQVLMKERKRKVLALIPLNLDGYLFDGWENGKASQVKARLAPDFRGWHESHEKCEEQIERVALALRADEHAREKPPESKL